MAIMRQGQAARKTNKIVRGRDNLNISQKKCPLTNICKGAFFIIDQKSN